MQAFYNEIAYGMRSMIDVTASGILISKTYDEAYNLIEEIKLNNSQWSFKRGQPKRVGGKFDADVLNLLYRMIFFPFL